ncbi:DUF1045 domain-containing protein [Cognatishimia activa]|uniref:DUF1045 domain-containing protein n=1 Tax=Cognatishimia activa TaxID=1715691 RepID=UPI002230FC76|nr:DUF1045 domain-containing protein [Cognatishimia activa]UZD91100.1 DUF1045 domain-containing protein [Cognatishimia activa]
MDFQRYAIYYTAPAGPLADFGAAWLGWDVASGQPVDHPPIRGLDEDISSLTKNPRKYGFHGTIKPPFRLAEGKTVEQLASATERLCRNLDALTLEGLELTQIGRFLALTVIGETRPLAELASKVVRSLDAFRAPPTDAELAKRRKANLSDRQDAYLMEWGYPYVMEEFRFHLTLTGRLQPNLAKTVHDILEPALANVLPIPFQIADLTLAGEDQQGQFHEVRRFNLATQTASAEKA